MPTVSIIIPVGKSHVQYIGTAIASCLYQTVQDFEVIVVNDSGQHFISPHDKVKVIESPNYKKSKEEGKGNRAAVARNAGIAKAQGEYVVFLDADDYLLPTALETFFRGHVSHNKTYTYSSHFVNQQHMRPPAYDQRKYELFNLHPITCLIPTKAVRAVGGFDESAPGWEDWTLFLRLAMAGFCGEYYRGATFVYRSDLSINHVVDINGGQELMNRVVRPYFKNGAIPMAACCGGGNKQSARRIVSQLGDVPMSSDNTYHVEYIGNMKGSFKIKHPTSGRIYRIGGTSALRFIQVPPEDLQYFTLNDTQYRVVSPPASYNPAPEAIPMIVEAQSTLHTDLPTHKLTETDPHNTVTEAVIDLDSGAVKSVRGRKKLDA